MEENKFTPLEHSAIIIHIICGQIVGMHETYNAFLKTGFDNDDYKRDMAYRLIMSSYESIIIKVTSLIDEFEWHFKKATPLNDEEKRNLNFLKEVCEPVFEGFKKWEHLREARNQMFAHGFRKKVFDGKKHVNVPILGDGDFKNYSMPVRQDDFEYIYHLSSIIHDQFWMRFGLLYFKHSEMIRSFEGKPSPPIDIRKEMNDIDEQVEKAILKAQGFLRDN